MKDRLYRWHLSLVRAYLALTPRELAQIDEWQSRFPSSALYDWPGWPGIIGERPQSSRMLAFRKRPA